MSSAGHDAFAHDDAAYVLGALSPTEREAFESHLASCADCRSAVAELAGMPGLLASLPPEEAETHHAPDRPGLPGSTLPALLREVSRARRRRRLEAVTLGLAASVLAVTAVLWRGIGSTPAETSVVKPVPSAVITLEALRATPVGATAALTPVAWGTRIGLHCTYDSGPAGSYGSTSEAGGQATRPSGGTAYAPGVYRLVVLARDGHRGEAASWLALPGRSMDIDAATAVDAADIAALEVRTADGSVLLRGPAG